MDLQTEQEDILCEALKILADRLYGKNPSYYRLKSKAVKSWKLIPI